MSRGTHQPDPHVVAEDWVSFPGGELEGKRPKALCPACRDALDREVERPVRTLCFQCYRLELDRERALRAAGALDTASEQRFQCQLPFEPVNHARLASLKASRAEARDVEKQGAGVHVDRRRRAQIAARRALQKIAAGLTARGVAPAVAATTLEAVTHAAELQLPAAWLPFVLSR